MTSYDWDKDDMSRYNQEKEPPCPVWHLDPFTPIVPVSFLRLAWHNGFEPCCLRTTEFSSTRIDSLPPSLIICDIFPPACTRLPHGRFILQSNSLPNVRYHGKFKVNKGLLDQYSIDWDDIVNSILSLLSSPPTATIGLCGRLIQASEYVRSLKDV